MSGIFRYIIIWLAAGLIFFLVACSDDLYPDREDPEKPSGERLYFSVKVKTAGSSTRADADNDLSFTDGVHSEHALDYSGKSDNVIIFFNNEWKYCGYTPLEIDLQHHETSETPGVEATYIGFMRSAFSEGINSIPDYGLMVLNAHNITNALDAFAGKDIRIEDILALTDTGDLERMAGRRGEFFTMTSSAYLENEEGEWKHSLLFKINKENIFLTTHQAILAPAAVATVERMASKFSLSLPGATSQGGISFNPDGGRAQVIVCNYSDGQPIYNNRLWTCSVVGWGINKYEPSQYYFKNIVTETQADITSYPYNFGSDINTTGHPFFNGWNRSSEWRTRWAVDPHYKDGVYPVQYRPAVDNPDIEYYGQKEVASLGYISFNQLSTDLDGIGEKEGVKPIYSTENTFPDTRARGLWQHDFAASEFVLGAQIHINGVNERKADYDLYRNRIGIFYPSATDFATYFITTINNQLASQSTMTYRYYDWTNPEFNREKIVETLKVDNSNYKLYYGTEPLTPERMVSLSRFTIAATIENGDGKVIPWVEGMYIGRRDIDPDTYQEIGEIKKLRIDNNAFKSLIYDWIGAFDHFNRGRMVYSVPILHKASSQKVSQQGYRPTVGDFGVVRNHWYQISVDAINSLGNPVDDPDQKIIPYDTGLENSIQVEISVLDWHEFATDVTLPDHLK